MGKQTGCYADSIAANPNRPTVTNPAHVTEYGVLELEYGWDRMWLEMRIHQTALGGLLKFGLVCDIELRWNTTSFLSQTDVAGTPNFRRQLVWYRDPNSPADEAIANDGFQFCLQGTLGRYGEWVGQWARRSLIHLWGEREYRAFQF
jgi:hypothetical protein